MRPSSRRTISPVQHPALGNSVAREQLIDWFDDGLVPQRVNAEAAFAILEHEQMHQETLLYMFHEMPYELKSPRRPLRANGYVNRQPDTKNRSIRVPAGEVSIGACDGDFCWD